MDDRFLVETYACVASDEEAPVHQGFDFDPPTADIEPWERFGDRAKDTFVHLDGRGDCLHSYVLDLAAGESSCRQRHRYEELVCSRAGSDPSRAGPGDRSTPSSAARAACSRIR
jgi:hypothetical protein